MNSQHRKVDSDLTVTTKKGHSKSILNLLNKTVLGTPGKLRYRHVQTNLHDEKISDITFIQIKKRERVLGTAGFIERNITFNSTSLKALYVRYLSVYNPLKKQKRKRSNVPTQKKPNVLRSNIEKIFQKELQKPFLKADQKGLYYAYVEADNSLSKELCESFGFKEIRVINTFLFSRFFPKNRDEVVALDKDKHESFSSSLRHFYYDHNFVFTDFLEDFGTCYVFKQNGEEIAGIRAIPVHWEIVEMPGWKGFMMLRILPKIPFFKRLFKPDRLKFLAFDSLWYKPGHANKTQNLMEHACSDLGYFMGMIWQDEKSNTAKSLVTKNKLGLLHTINGVVKANLMVRDIDMNSEDFSELKDKPAFVSAFDMI